MAQPSIEQKANLDNMAQPSIEQGAISVCITTIKERYILRNCIKLLPPIYSKCKLKGKKE